MSVLWLWLACGLHRPHYDSVPFVLEPLEPFAARAFHDGLRHDLERGRLRSLTVDGEPVAPEAVADAPTPAVRAAWALQRSWARGAELDVWMPHDGGFVPVTLWLDGRDATVQSGAWAPERPAPAPAPEARRVDGDVAWSPYEAAVAADALARLTPAEQARVGDVVLRRMAVSRRAPGRELAWFDPLDAPPSIEVYDLAFAAASAFVGPVDAPVDPATLTLVHELGHALADAPLREAGGWSPTLTRGGPVIRAFRALDLPPGPTPYARRSVHEAFAEAFALWKLDPDALRRTQPDALAWFEAGGHLAALEAAPAPR